MDMDMDMEERDAEKLNRDYDFPVTPAERERIEQIADHYREIIRLLGDQPDREGLQKTPMRAAKAMWYATKGFRQDPQEIIHQAVFDHQGSRMVVVRDIEFYSLCEHHILPFFGTVDVGYIPDGEMIGISKLARLVDAVARRLQVQERMTAQICQALAEGLKVKGVIVSATAQHLCMKMRGVEKQYAQTDTLDYCGLFAEQPELRREFYELTRRK